MKQRNKREIRKSRRVILLAAVIILSVLLVLSIVAFLLEKLSDNGNTTSDGLSSTDYKFYIPTGDEPALSEDPQYLALNRYMVYTTDLGESYTITDGNYKKFGVYSEFMARFFDTLVQGNADEYNSLFSENFFGSHEKTGAFTPQRIYEKKVAFLEENTENGQTSAEIRVEYKIMKNDGTLRTDIGSDMSRVQYFSLVSHNGDIKINKITSVYNAG